MMDEDNLQQANIPGGKTSNEEEKTTKTLEIPYSQAEAAYSLRLQRQCQSEGGNEVGQDFIYEDKEESVVLGSEGPALVLAESASSQLNDQRLAFSAPWGGQSSELKISQEQLQQQFSQFQQQQQPNSQKSIQVSTQMQMISQSPQQSPLHLQAMASQTSQRRVSLASQQNSQRQISQLSQQKSLPVLISPQLSPEASLGVSQKYEDNYSKGNGSMRGIEFEQQKQMQADNLLRRQYLTSGQQEQQQGWGEEQKNNFTSEEVGEALEELKTGQVQSGLDKFEAYLHKGFRTLNADTFGKVFMRIVKRLNNLSVDFLYKGDIQSAILLLTKCDQWTQTPGFGYFPALRALILNHFGCTFRRQEQFKKAVSCCEQALQILQNSNERNYRGLTYLNLSALSSQQGEHKKGLDLARIALLESQHEFMEELKTRKNKSPGENEYDDDEEDLDYQNKIHTLVISYHNIAAEEEYFGNYEEALLHYEYSLGAAEEHLGQNSKISEHFREQFTKFTQRYAHYKIEGRPVGVLDALIVHSDQFQVTAKTKKKGQAGNKKRNLKKNGERSFSAKLISPYQEPKQQRILQKQPIQQQQQPQSEEQPNASDPQYDFTGFPNKKPEETQGRIFSAGNKRSNSSNKRPLSSQRPVSAVFSGQSINQFRIEAEQQRNKYETQRIGSPKKLVFVKDEPELFQIKENRQSQHAAEGQEMRLVRVIKRKSSKKKIKQTKNLSLRGYPLESAEQQDQNNLFAQQSMFNNKSIDFASLFPSKAHFSSATQAKYQQIQTSQPGAYFQQFQGVSAFKGGPNYGGSQIAEGQTSNSNNNGKSFDRNCNSNLLFFNGENQSNNMSKNLTFQYQQQPSFSVPSNLRPQTPSMVNQNPQEIVFLGKESDLKKLEKQQQSQPSSNSKKGISRIQLLESLQKQYQQASNNLQSLESKIQEEIAKNASKNNKDRFDTEQNYENEPSSNSPSKRNPIKPTHKKSSSYSSIKNMFSAGTSNKTGRQNSLSSLAVVEGEKKLIYLPDSQFQIRSAKGSISSSSNTSLTTTTKNNHRRTFTSNGTLLASTLQPSQAAPLSATNLQNLQKQPEPITVSNFSAPASSWNLQNKNPLSDSRKQPEKQILAVGINPNTPSTQSSWQTTPLNSGQFQNLTNNQTQQQYQYQPPLNAWRVYQNQGWLQFPMNQNFLGASTDNKSIINTQETLVNILRTQLSCLNSQQDKLLFEGNLRFVLNRTKLQLQIAFTSEQFVGQLEHSINVSDLFISHQTDDFAMVGLLVAFSGEILKSLFVNISQNCLSIFFTNSKNSSNIGDGQILLDKVLLKLDVKHLSMKQDVEIVIKNSYESILLLCEESAPLQDSHTNDDGTNEGEDNIKPLVNTDILNIHLNREQSNKTEQSSTDSINPLVIDAGSTAQQERNFRRNNLTSVRGKRSVGEEMILEVIEETDTFSQLKNNHMNVTNTQSLSNIGNTLPNSRSSFINNNNQNSVKNSEVVNSKTEGESTGKGSRNKEKRENNYQDDIFEEIQDLDDAGGDDDFEKNVKLAVAEGELKQNNSRPKSSYEKRVPPKKKQRAEKETDLPQGQDKLPKDGQAKVIQEEQQGKGNKQDNIVQEIEDTSTPTSKYGFQTRDFMKRKPQASNSKLLLEIESAFELPHDDVRFDNDKKQLSNFGGFEEEPGFSNSKREHTFDDSPNQSLQEIVAETMEGQQTKQGINLRPRTTSSPTVTVEGQQRQMNKKGSVTNPTNRADYNKNEQLPLKEEDQNARRATPPPKIVINNGFDNEDPYLAYDNKQQEEANNLRQQEDEKANQEFQKLLEESDPERLNFTAALIQRRFRNKKIAKDQEEQKLKGKSSTKEDKQKKTETQVVVKEEKKENAEIVVLDGPIEEYEKVASLIGNAFRNRKKKEKEQKREKGTAATGVGSTQNNNPTQQGNNKIVDLKDSTQKADKNLKGNEPGGLPQKEEEKVVLEGPIEEYEQVASKIGAAFRMKKKRQAEAAEALKKQKELQNKQIDQGQLEQNNTTPFSSSLIANTKQEIANPNDLSHGSEAAKVLSEEQEKLLTGESVLNDTDALGNASQEQANIPIVKKKSQVQGKFKLNRRFKQQVDFII